MTERSRDRYGRPLPVGDDRAFPVVSERSSITAEEAWREAVALIQDDLPFHAHEVFEQRWRCSPLEDREAWRLCARWAAALTHLARGNANGACAIARQTRSSLRSLGVLPQPVDRDLVDRSLTRILVEIEGETTAAVESSPS